LNEKMSDDMYSINFKAQFMSSNVNFSPEFVWLFNNNFLESIKHLALGNSDSSLILK